MATGFLNGAGVDLDDVFDLYTGGQKAAPTGFLASNGLDLSDRYAPLSAGTQVASTGWKIASGADLNTVFAAKGSTAISVTLNPAGDSESAASNSRTFSPPIQASASGGSGSYTYAWTLVTASGGIWNLGDPTGPICGVGVSGVDAGTTAIATVRCTATDTVTGRTASASANYVYTHNA